MSSDINKVPAPISARHDNCSRDSLAAHFQGSSGTPVETHYPGTSTTATPSTPTISSESNPSEPTQGLGSREAIELMIIDYLDLLYPLMPVVHRPSFRADFGRERDEHDQIFYSLLLTICAMVVAQLPRRFLDYKKARWFFEFNTPKQLVVHLEERVLGLRNQEYFETPSTQKCAIAFFLACSYGSLNVVGRMSLYWAEMWVMLRALGANDPQTYIGLNFVEAQLRKKSFWLYVYYSV
ncbi:hypothetical protein LTR84_009740 [Exophiala bonariae]|uniref:Transcription factor domain-containing protein n=1 Tax=Exophiala bonariae TaxID=1690606 RepID=A0AAV9NJ52_9EURO|nr:hypothetical protein LTR84_009740 [Exophiala bonariae]